VREWLQLNPRQYFGAPRNEAGQVLIPPDFCRSARIIKKFFEKLAEAAVE
jgi:hypothetical protein